MIGDLHLRVLLVDVLGTLFPFEPLRPRLERAGLRGTALETWTAAALRDAFAHGATGSVPPFRKVLAGALEETAAASGVALEPREAREVLAGLDALEPRAHALEALEAARTAGVRVLAVTNGSASETRALLRRGDLHAVVEEIVTAEEAGAFKPRPEIYNLALKTAGARAGDAALVSAHPWDVNGARAAGLHAGWLATGRPYTPGMREPDAQAASLVELVRLLSPRGA